MWGHKSCREGIDVCGRGGNSDNGSFTKMASKEEVETRGRKGITKAEEESRSKRKERHDKGKKREEVRGTRTITKVEEEKCW